MIAALIGAAVGGAAGFGYYRFVGCRTGTCPIWASPWMSTMYGAVLGATIATF